MVKLNPGGINYFRFKFNKRCIKLCKTGLACKLLFHIRNVMLFSRATVAVVGAVGHLTAVAAAAPGAAQRLQPPAAAAAGGAPWERDMGRNNYNQNDRRNKFSKPKAKTKTQPQTQNDRRDEFSKPKPNREPNHKTKMIKKTNFQNRNKNENQTTKSNHKTKIIEKKRFLKTNQTTNPK